jgi:hypothetical protein
MIFVLILYIVTCCSVGLPAVTRYLPCLNILQHNWSSIWIQHVSELKVPGPFVTDRLLDIISHAPSCFVIRKALPTPYLYLSWSMVPLKRIACQPVSPRMSYQENPTRLGRGPKPRFSFTIRLLIGVWYELAVNPFSPMADGGVTDQDLAFLGCSLCVTWWWSATTVSPKNQQQLNFFNFYFFFPFLSVM